jgi:hypothetical protein
MYTLVGLFIGWEAVRVLGEGFISVFANFCDFVAKAKKKVFARSFQIVGWGSELAV